MGDILQRQVAPHLRCGERVDEEMDGGDSIAPRSGNTLVVDIDSACTRQAGKGGLYSVHHRQRLSRFRCLPGEGLICGYIHNAFAISVSARDLCRMCSQFHVDCLNPNKNLFPNLSGRLSSGQCQTEMCMSSTLWYLLNILGGRQDGFIALCCLLPGSPVVNSPVYP